MGGYGSGRHWIKAKATTSQYCQVDVRFWHRKGLLIPGRSFESQWTSAGKQIASIRVGVGFARIILSYRYRQADHEQWQPTNYPVLLDWTPCNYGGSRPWLCCPVQGCGRRVAILYLNGIFACRQCCQLAYNCQREPAHDRALRHAQAIRQRLGASGNMYEPFPVKPKGMHERTYERLRIAYAAADAQSWPPYFRKWITRRA